MATTDVHPTSPESGTAHGWRPVVGAALGLTTLLTLLLAAFTWPPSELEPRSLPLVIAAPAEQAGQVEGMLAAQAGEDAFDVSVVGDREAAVEAIEDREAYGAIVAGPDGMELLTSSAASPTVAQLLTQSVSGEAPDGSAAPAPVVTDVVPTSDDDPRGSVFNAGALPLAIGGIMVGAVTSMALRSTRERLVAVLGVGVAGGLALTGVLQGWLGAIEGSYWANAGVVTLGILAVALPIIGLRHLIGPAAIGVVAALILLVGNPLSGVTSAPELLPLGWLGQLLPPGATGSALRGTAYFDGAGVGLPLVVLACWAALGLALALVPRREPAAA
ncbi:hypothetical protein HNR19_000637 [Nocardioides thalensis]|uniref:ABC transporter permease n=1 Tax=Nocardioides thalensis TaxID=1914755 RepID=A0A853BXL8_9ACTN|nr:hypothetical protein [Nocardioides thalensis]